MIPDASSFLSLIDYNAFVSFDGNNVLGDRFDLGKQLFIIKELKHMGSPRVLKPLSVLGQYLEAVIRVPELHFTDLFLPLCKTRHNCGAMCKDVVEAQRQLGFIKRIFKATLVAHYIFWNFHIKNAIPFFNSA